MAETLSQGPVIMSSTSGTDLHLLMLDEVSSLLSIGWKILCLMPGL
jgi:hypothetical protein